MKILVLGGTRFLGRHLVEQALQRGHQVTLLHRGHSGPGLFPQAEHRIADRDRDLTFPGALGQGEWDVAIDTSAYVPRQVRQVAQALSGRVGGYQFVSTISVYASFAAAGCDEDAALATLPDPTTETVDGASYGGLKVLCEAAAEEGFAQHCLIVRPGLIVGPHDPTDRFTWWVDRMARGGDVLAPGRPDAPVQFIDARDLAAWQLDQAERSTVGHFNVTGPVAPLTMAGMLEGLRERLAPPSTRLVWVDAAYLVAQGVAPWSDLPVWLPQEMEGLARSRIARAIATGLRCRPLAEIAADTAAWSQSRAKSAAGPAASPMARPSVGLASEREAALLAGYAARH
jgi:2'-hydroxyisoflavone reductase